jgi:acetoacetyl-CoA synthetase
MNKPIWVPSEDRINNSNMTSFMRYVEDLISKQINSYDILYNWSINEIEEFWKSIWIISGVIHSQSYKEILSERKMLGAKWFEGARLNFAENLLKYNDLNTALISFRENYPIIKINYKELYGYVASCGKILREFGVKPGDRVAGLITNIPEAVVAMLASVSIGAVWSSCSPDYGFHGLLERFGQIKPKILFAVESYSYNGKSFNCSDKIKFLIDNIPTLEKTIIIPEFNDFQNSSNSEKVSDIRNSVPFTYLLLNRSEEIQFEQLPFDHPLYIMYSSGTTGKPKCIVHGAGGTLLQHFKELSLHTNLTRHDVITYFTTCGWMMWNWLISSLNIGSTIVLIDGSPVYPGVESLWRIIEEANVTVFGTSPRFLSICEKAGLKPKEKFNLDSLKTILSTGSPLSNDNYKWVYDNVKNDLQLSSISGGTDIISCFVLGNPNLPVYPGEIQCRGLGMKVESLDSNGVSVKNKKGELVCTAPFPSMPLYFWNDPKNEKYLEAYFNYLPGTWRHGDFIEITERGTVIIFGRSDATLNPGGVRIGTAEIYSIVESMDEISDSIAVGQNFNNDVRIILFVVLKKGFQLDEKLIKNIKENLKYQASPRHVPAKILEVTEIPKTINQKKVEVTVTKIINGEEIDNKSALINPESLKQFYNFNLSE